MYRHYIASLVNLLIWAAMPTLAGAAGTYYTGSTYQPVQYRYGQSGSYASSANYGRATTNGAVVANPNVRYTANYQSGTQSTNQTSSAARTSSQQKSSTRSSKGGFYAGAGFSHENASWNFDMKEAKSSLNYDGVAWNVLDLNGGYVFDLGKTITCYISL